MQAAPAFPEALPRWRWLARYLTPMTKLDQTGSHRPAGDARDGISRRLVADNVVFFPIATIYAIFVFPASVLALGQLSDVLQKCAACHESYQLSDATLK